MQGQDGGAGVHLQATIRGVLPHSLAGAGIVVVLYWCTGSMWPGAIAASAFFLGRERRDFEISQGLGERDWYKRWNILTWSPDNRQDLIPVSLLVWLMALVGSPALMWGITGVLIVLWLLIRPLSGREDA